MNINFFGREFFLFANDAQKEKAIGMITEYILKPQIIFLAIIVIIYFVLLFISNIVKNEKMTARLKLASPWVYFFSIISITILNREAGVSELRLYHDAWFTDGGFHESNVLGFMLNVLLYVPFGFLLYRWNKHERKAIWTCIYVVVTSLMIELLQYILARGVTSIDDVAANTIGGLIGLGFAFLLKRLLKKMQGVGKLWI